MTIILDVVEQEDLFTNSLGVEIDTNPKEKADLRRQLKDDIDAFIAAGGIINRIENNLVEPRNRRVGFNKEGMAGSFSGYSNDSV